MTQTSTPADAKATNQKTSRPAKGTRFQNGNAGEWTVTSVRKGWDGRIYVHATPSFAYDAGSRTGLSARELTEWNTDNA